jgi:chromosome partitioning protein
MATVISVCNEKGGVSKTTTTAALADGLTKRGYKTLCVDLDSQAGNLSVILSADKENVIGSYEVFTSRPNLHDPKEFIQKTEHELCDLIAANSDLALAEGLLVNASNKETRLKTVLDPLREDYDYILIDTPRAFNILTVNALITSDKVIIPSLADSLSVHGLQSLILNIEAIKSTLNPTLEIAGILITQFDGKTGIQNMVGSDLTAIASHYNVNLFKTYIRKNTHIPTAQYYKKRLSEYKVRGKEIKGSIDYNNFVVEFLALSA